MERQGVAISQSSTVARSQRETERLAAELENIRPITKYTELVPIEICAAAITAGSRDLPAIGFQRARTALAVMLSGKPQAILRRRGVDPGDDTDLELYSKRMASVLARYPECDVAVVIAPGTGVAASTKFLPDEHELEDALAKASGRRARRARVAALHNAERQRRADEEAREAALAAERAAKTPEQIAASVKAMVDSFKAMPSNEPARPPDRTMTAAEIAADLAAIRERATPEAIAENTAKIESGVWP